MRLLIVGCLHGHTSEAAHIAQSRGVQVTQVDSLEVALAFLRKSGADLIFMDIEFDVSRFLTALRSERINTPVIACGVGNETQMAVAAIKAGAEEYLPLPPDVDLISAVIETFSRLENSLIHKDPLMTRVVQLAERIAESDASVLITGESGTGKEVMARYLHMKSKRSKNPFVSVNCAAIPEHLLESELFGHEKGAFTGAVARRIGKFEEANKGTLLLDEVTEMHPRLQAKLLRALQEREIDRVGGRSPVKVNLRILATSNRNMEEAVAQGIFREDLYFRLNVVALNIPPLRDRMGDTEPLAKYFLEKYCHVNELPLKKLSSGALQQMRQHLWKGNVRELENAMHRAVLLAPGEKVDLEHVFLDLTISKPTKNNTEKKPLEMPNGELVGRTVSDVERDLILNTLSYCSGNRTYAATVLGISIRTLRNKLKLYREEGIEVPEGQCKTA